jgi:hypothetical protein
MLIIRLNFVLVIFLFILSLLCTIYSLVGLSNNKENDERNQIYSALLGFIIGKWTGIVATALMTKYSITGCNNPGDEQDLESTTIIKPRIPEAESPAPRQSKGVDNYSDQSQAPQSPPLGARSVCSLTRPVDVSL